MFNELNNRIQTVKEGINTRDLDFAPLKNFVGQTIRVDGFFFTTGKYGKSVVVVGNGFNVNMPKRAVEQFEKIYNDGAMVEAVLNGKLLITGIKEISAKEGDTVAYELTDC